MHKDWLVVSGVASYTIVIVKLLTVVNPDVVNCRTGYSCDANGEKCSRRIIARQFYNSLSMSVAEGLAKYTILPC